MLAYPTNRAGYVRLCRLLTLGKGRAGKHGCTFTWADLVAHGDGLIVVLLPDAADPALAGALARLRRDFAGRCYLALSLRRRPGDAIRLRQLADLAQAARVPTVATGDVLYHVPERRVLQDVLTCIREGCTIDDAGFRRERFADRHLKAPAEMARLFAAYPEVVARTAEIAARCRFSLSELRYQYPDESEVPGETPQAVLERLVREGVPRRYPGGLPPDVGNQLRHELRLIAELAYAPYFLTVHSIVRFARSRDILCQGRGSAANSAVCFVLGVTAIDPVRSGLLFERFVSADRREPPDIDVDFESERREEVIQWVFEHYGRDRAALCCTVMRFRARGAIRDVGQVLGLPEDVTGALASQVWGGGGSEGLGEDHAAALDLNLGDRRLRLALELARELVGFPRQLGTHPGGFVLTEDQLSDLVPVAPAAMAGRQVIEWDKDDIDALGWMKVDVLGLGMLGCLRRAFALLSDREPGADGDAAAAQAQDVLRPGGAGRHRAARPDPGRHGAPLPAPPRGPGRSRLSQGGTQARAGQDLGRAAVPGTGNAGRDPLRRLHPGRDGPAPPLDGDVQSDGRRVALPRQAGRRHGRTRLRARLRRADLFPVGGLRLLRLSGEPRRLLCAARLCQRLDQVPPPRRVLRGAAEQPANGLLRPGAGGARRLRSARNLCKHNKHKQQGFRIKRRAYG